MKNLLVLPLLIFFVFAFGQSEIKNPDFLTVGDNVYKIRITKEDDTFIHYYTLDENGNKVDNKLKKKGNYIFEYANYASENFSIEKDELIWQKVYETSLTFDDIVKAFINSGGFFDHLIVDNQITGYITNVEPKFKEAGFTRGFTPMPYLDNIKAYTISEYKEGRYRVTLKKITLLNHLSIALLGGGGPPKDTPLDIYAFNKQGKFIPAFKKHSSIYEITFDDIFALKNKLDDGEW